VPDWPNSYGYNMFLFPPNRWVGGIFYEHTHRLMGTVVGFLAVMLAMMAWGPARSEWWRTIYGWTALLLGGGGVAVATGVLIATRSLQGPINHLWVGMVSLASVALVAWLSRKWHESRAVRWLCVGVLIAVIVQGTLGGLRVDQVSLTLAIVHGAFAQLVFCLTGLACVMTSRWWSNQTPPAIWLKQGERLIKGGAVVVALVFGQLILGALMRHHGAGLAIPDLPLAYGQWLPPLDGRELERANKIRAWDLQMDPVSLGQVWLHYAHRAGAIVVTLAVGLLVAYVIRRHRKDKIVRGWTAALACLVVVQLTLGVLTVYMRKPADVATTHVACGALVLMTAFVLTTVAVRLYWPHKLAVRRQVMTTESPPGGFVTV
jgi:cytochrome c oxidase assembly protein subunit 15